MQICYDSPPVQPEELCVGILRAYLSEITSVCMCLESKEKGTPQYYWLGLKNGEEKVIKISSWVKRWVYGLYVGETRFELYLCLYVTLLV